MKSLRYFILLSVFILPILVNAGTASFSKLNRLSGYKQNGETAIFIFDPAVYNINPDKIMLEGSMRNWEHNMNDPKWELSKETDGSLWLLKMNNPGMSIIPAGSAFKFRINGGEWLEPAADAPNVISGNLIFAHELKKMAVNAEIVSAKDIRLIFPDKRPQYLYDISQYTLTRYDGTELPVERIIYIKPGELCIVPATDIDIRRLHYLEVKYLSKKVTVTYDGWFRLLYSDKELGANYDPELNATIIRLFAPRADSVFVFLYKKPNNASYKKIKMQAASDGIWEGKLKDNKNGLYYEFCAYGPDEPGNTLSDADNEIHFSDPWGRVSVDSHGPCRIWPKVKPASPLKNGIPKMEDVIAYEVHIQDFTRYLPVADSLKGTFKAFSQPGLKNSAGEKVGFDHLIELGINTVHLMPVQEYLHFPDTDWQKAFAKDPYMIEQGINRENYQWGYRTSHAFAIESRYRVKGTEWGAQNEQFRDLVQAFHDQDIAVIVDLVFNHTAELMDSRRYYFNFLAMDIPYFYRTDQNLDIIGAYGTETKSEERPMMQRWIIEQCTNLINQFGIDGFRIDLAGLTDEQTLRALREAVGPDIIIYGEPWIGSNDPEFEANPDWDWYKEDSPITFFQDDSRNAFKGTTDNPVSKETNRGFAGGSGNREEVKKALSAGFPEDKNSISGINYLDIHDNWALADRFASRNWDGRLGVDEAAFKIVATLLFTSTGPIVLHGGTELMRSKGRAPLKEVVKYLNGKPLHFHGKRDTYNLAEANAFIWENKGRNIGGMPEIYCNYKNMFDFWKGLAALRKSKYGEVFRIADKPAKDYYKWFKTENKKLLGYLVDNKIFILINTDKKLGNFKDISLPAGDWQKIADIDKINISEGIKEGKYIKLNGSKKLSVELDKESLMIWVKKFE